MKFDIITIGSATRDVFLILEDLKKIKSGDFRTGEAMCLGLGSKLAVDKIVLTTGGGGTNAAVTFARQGLKTSCIGAIGDDMNGEAILKELELEGIDTQFFQRPVGDDLTAYSVILVDKSGERTILSYKGEGQNFESEKVPFDKLETNWLFLDSLGGHYDLLRGAVEWATQNDIKIATDPGGKELDHGFEKLKILLEKAKIVHMNQEEAAKLTGINYEKEDELFKFMDSIVKGIFILSKGPKGVVVSDGKNIYKAGIPNSPVVERTGAGDAFTSGFVSEYIKTSNTEKAIQFGTANASSVVSQFGAKGGILKKDNWGSWPLIEVEIQPF